MAVTQAGRIEQTRLFIGGEWREPVSGETYATINPATEAAAG